MTIESFLESRHELGVAAGTFVIPTVGENPSATDLEKTVDRVKVLRRLGPAVATTVDGVSVLRCRVEYGYVLGAWKADLRKHLARSAESLGVEVRECRIEEYRRRVLRTPAQLEAAIAELVKEARDQSVPDERRDHAAVLAERLREYAKVVR